MEGSAATVPCPGHAAADTPLDDAEAIARLAAESTRRRKASPFATAYSKWLFPLIDVRDWGTRRRFRITTNDAWNDWYSGRRDVMRFPPRKLPIYRLDAHTRPGHRHDADKLLVTVGRHEWLAMVMLDADGHHGEPDVRRAFDWARDTYFGGDLYDEPADRGHHGYPLFDRRGVSDEELNDLLHRADVALGASGKAAGKAAPLELKARVTLLDARGHIVKRGGLFAPPRLPCGWESLDQLRGSTVHPLDVLRRIISGGKRLTINRAQVTVPTPAGAAKVSRRPSGPTGGRYSSDPHELKLQVAQKLFSDLGRRPTLAEALAEYNPLRDHASDPVRERKMRAAIDVAARTFDPSKCKPRVSWEGERARLVALAESHCTRAAFEAAGREDYFGSISATEFGMALFSLEAESFTKKPAGEAFRQFTWGKKSIREMLAALSGGGIQSGKLTAVRDVLAAAGLAEVVDSRWRVASDGRPGISKKYHIGPAHPRYGEFVKWADANGVGVVKVADLSGDTPDPAPAPAFSGKNSAGT
jgi:hypothetical protein